jgi:hypothetical protein
MNKGILKILSSILIISFIFSVTPQITNAATRKPVLDRVAPTVPRYLKNQGATDTAITLSWQASKDAVGVKAYEIYRNGIRIATTPAISYTNTRLQSGKSYKFTVKATDAAGNRSRVSNTVTAKTLSVRQASNNTPLNISNNAAISMSEVLAQFPIHNEGTFFRDAYGIKPDITTNVDVTIMVDTGSTPSGVVLVNINKLADDKVWKAILKGPTGSYAYTLLKRNTFEGLPLQQGNGSYTLNIYEQVSGTSYTTRMAIAFNVILNSSLSPFTASSMMVNFSASSASTKLAASLVEGKSTQAARIEAIYLWIVQNIQYDRVLAASIKAGDTKTYIPDPNTTLLSGKGICFDYAALLAAMLRSQGIPARLILGQVPMGYHAWNEVYLEGTGWIRIGGMDYTQVTGNAWIMLDATLASGGLSSQTILNMTHTVERIY